MSASTGSGGDFLAKRSDLNRLRKDLPRLSDVVIVEDESFDAEKLMATLRVMFGYELGIRRASTLSSAIDRVMEKKPQLIFLDDLLAPSDNAGHTIPMLRRADYDGPIVVISGQVTKKRRMELLAAGATDVIHKEHLESVRLAEALVRVFSGGKDA